MFTIDNTVLLLVDVQGKLARIMYGNVDLFENLQKLVKGLKILGVPIIWMEQIPENLGATIPELAQIMTDIKPISKKTFSCCGNKEFMEKFSEHNKKQVLIAGIETHICVYQTALDLLNKEYELDKKYEVKIVSDCVSSRTFENKKVGIQMTKAAGCSLTSVEAILFELMKVAEGDKFKKLIKVVK